MPAKNKPKRLDRAHSWRVARRKADQKKWTSLPRGLEEKGQKIRQTNP
jgi:hypothetical protein